MNEPMVVVRFDGNGRVYLPGDILSGEYRLESFAFGQIRSIEISDLWHTEGKGDEDMAVHEFQRLVADDGDWIDPGRPGRFSVVLPNSPLTYDGVIVKIRWCVRVRVFPRKGKQVVGEREFRLGNVAAVPTTAP
jgi:hypothetical protein